MLDGLIEQAAGSKVEAVRSVAASLDRLTADLAALAAVPFDEATARRPLTWSAYSLATREESYHDKETGRLERSGRVTATVALQVTVRDLDTLGDLSGVLAADPSLDVHGVMWHVDGDNPAWPQVRAAAFGKVGGHGENVSEADLSAIAEVGSNGKDRGMTSTETFENLDPPGRRRDRAI